MQFNVGFVGEQNSRNPVIDISKYFEKWPGSVPQLLVTRPDEDDTTPYTATTTYNRTDGTLTWHVNAFDTEKEGEGWAQLVFAWETPGDNDTTVRHVGKSGMMKVRIQKSLPETNEEVIPDPYDTWVAVIMGYAADAATAKEAAETAQEAAELAQDKAEDAQEAAETAQAAAELAQDKAEDAQTAAETAQGKAEDAQEAAETAQAKAEDAQEAAELAQGKAEDAQEAAETAQGKAEDAQEAAETAQEAASDHADEAQAWATGMIGETEVPSTAAQYENNAKYYAEQAADAAAAAQGIIDDTAGVGDTGKTWSANKLAPISDDVDVLKRAVGTLSNLNTDEKTSIVAAINEVNGRFLDGVDEAVSDWLTAHPEATTTVQDGSLTEAKFSDALKLKAIKDYVTPQMFEAVGDGENDDTEAIQSALTYADTVGGAVYFPAGTYLVTNTLLAGDRTSLTMNPKAVIKAGDIMDVVLQIGGYTGASYLTQRPEYRNIFVDGNSKAVTGIKINKISMSGTLAISGMTAKNCTGTGIICTDCQGGNCIAVRSINNGGDGIQLLGCNGMKFLSISALNNAGHGIVCDRSNLCTGTPIIFGLSAEGNGGSGVKIGSGEFTGPISMYAGHLESNGEVPIFIDEKAKVLIDSFRIIWGSDEWISDVSYCTIKSSFATIRSIEIQSGDHSTIIPNIVGNVTPIIDDVQRATLRIYSEIGQKVFPNVISGGDMDRNSGIDVYSAQKTYKSTDLVDTDAGRTYSLKCAVSAASGFGITILNTTGLHVGQLYKITCRFYYQGNNTVSFRISIRDMEASKYYNGTKQTVSNNEWVEMTAYFYAPTSQEIRFLLSAIDDNPSIGDIIYMSTYFVQPVTHAKVASKQIGTNYVYEIIEPATLN